MIAFNPGLQLKSNSLLSPLLKSFREQNPDEACYLSYIEETLTAQRLLELQVPCKIIRFNNLTQQFYVITLTEENRFNFIGSVDCLDLKASQDNQLLTQWGYTCSVPCHMTIQGINAQNKIIRGLFGYSSSFLQNSSPILINKLLNEKIESSVIKIQRALRESNRYKQHDKIKSGPLAQLNSQNKRTSRPLAIILNNDFERVIAPIAKDLGDNCQVFSQVRHATNEESLSSILKLGTLFAKKQRQQLAIASPPGLARKTDDDYGDSPLISTTPTPLAESTIDPQSCTLTLNLKSLNSTLMLKHIDWMANVAAKHSQFQPLLDTGIINITYQIQGDGDDKFFASFKFTDKENRQSETVQVKFSDMLCYGSIQELNYFISTTLFRVMTQLKNQTIASQVYRYFDDSADVATELKRLSKIIYQFSELNIIGALQIKPDTLVSIQHTSSPDLIEPASLIMQYKEGTLSLNQILLNQPILQEYYHFLREIKNIALENDDSETLTILHELALVLEPPPLFTSPAVTALAYAYDNYLRHAYKKSSSNKQRTLQLDSGTQICRPNHGLLHTARKMSYIPQLIALFTKHAHNQEDRDFFNALTPLDIEHIQIALAFSVSGRESEAGFSDNKIDYIEFKKNSAVYYEQYALAINLPETIIEQYKEIIAYLSNPSYPNIIDINEQADYGIAPTKQCRKRVLLHKLLSFAHELDLHRCQETVAYTNNLEKGFMALFNKTTPDFENDYLALIENVKHLIFYCGESIGHPQTQYKKTPIDSLHSSISFATESLQRQTLFGAQQHQYRLSNAINRKIIISDSITLKHSGKYQVTLKCGAKTFAPIALQPNIINLIIPSLLVMFDNKEKLHYLILNKKAQQNCPQLDPIDTNALYQFVKENKLMRAPHAIPILASKTYKMEKAKLLKLYAHENTTLFIKALSFAGDFLQSFDLRDLLAELSEDNYDLFIIHKRNLILDIKNSLGGQRSIDSCINELIKTNHVNKALKLFEITASSEPEKRAKQYNNLQQKIHAKTYQENIENEQPQNKP